MIANRRRLPFSKRSISKRGFQKMEERETGTVKWFNNRKGYGFITRDVGGDVFVHYSSLAEQEGFRSLEEGRVSSTRSKSAKRGPQPSTCARYKRGKDRTPHRLGGGFFFCQQLLSGLIALLVTKASRREGKSLG